MVNALVLRRANTFTCFSILVCGLIKCLANCARSFAAHVMICLCLAQDKNLPRLKKMTARSRFGSPLMMFCAAYAASTGFTHAPEPMLKLVRHVFEGFLQSRINEKANKVLRDSETRENASKAAGILAQSCNSF